MPERDEMTETMRMRPNPVRQLVYVVVTVASIAAGYFAYLYFVGPKAPPEKVETAEKTQPKPSPEPWYKKQTPPPTLITTPDLPIFPEPEEEKITPPERHKAYEEALPRDTYEAPTPPAPVAAAPTTPTAPAPRVKPDDTAALPTWQRYALPVPDTGTAPVIAVVIDDMGIDVKRSTRISNLGGPMTLSYLTYGKNLPKQTSQAATRGHELMLHVAMEPSSKAVDPGPNVLLTELDGNELRRRLDWGFGRFEGYTGINNHMGSK
ncbi:MAG: divergent polysaccharide deacetylase family protein, partial [Rhodospirillaceae bacterium]|nr:divergent polysaccharide deacetylase family protein [Rhodospirillaceae bacterium]